MSNAHIENRKLRICLWLVTLLQKHQGLTYDELNHYWQQDEAISDGRSLPKRTFLDYRGAIQDTLGIVVECDRRTNRYSITLQADGGLSEWLISSFSVGLLVEESQAVRDRILLAPSPQGMEHWSLLVESFRRQCCVELWYQKFQDDEPQCHRLQPYCLKSYGGRWYLLAAHHEVPTAADGAHLQLLTYALDRITQLRLLSHDAFVPDADFSPQAYFANSFGVWASADEPPLIRLRVTGRERHYLRTQPLHASQREVPLRPCDDGYAPHTSHFLLRCHATRDLMLALLSHGRDLEVLEPASLRRELAEEVRAMAEHYGENNN